MLTNIIMDDKKESIGSLNEFLKSTSDVDPRTPEEIAQGTIPASDQDRRAEAAWKNLLIKKSKPPSTHDPERPIDPESPGRGS
jgi:hypothetical protein